MIVSAISPFKEAGDQVRRNIGEDIVEVYVNAPLEVCAARDVKGLYKKVALVLRRIFISSIILAG